MDVEDFIYDKLDEEWDRLCSLYIDTHPEDIDNDGEWFETDQFTDFCLELIHDWYSAEIRAIENGEYGDV